MCFGPVEQAVLEALRTKLAEKEAEAARARSTAATSAAHNEVKPAGAQRSTAQYSCKAQPLATRFLLVIPVRVWQGAAGGSNSSE